MKENKEELIKSVRKIKECCDRQILCMECPFEVSEKYSLFAKCMFETENFPADWEIDKLKTKEDLLTDEERKYLSCVIAPFRDKVKNISKEEHYFDEELEFICITCEKEDIMTFPNFKAGTMYKGMEVEKEYTLEDLKL